MDNIQDQDLLLVFHVVPGTTRFRAERVPWSYIKQHLPQPLKGDKGDPGKDGVGLKGDKGDPGIGTKGDKGDQGTPKRVERYAATVTNGVATIVFSTPFTSIPDVQVIDSWGGTNNMQQTTGAVTSVSLTGCTVAARQSRGTLILTDGPYQVAPNGAVITVRAIG